MNGDSAQATLGGIRAIRELIDCTSSSSEEKVVKFSNALARALMISTDFILIERIAEAIGYIARHSPVGHQDYVETELERALEWLNSDFSHRRLAACAVLQQLAENAPTVFFVRAKEFFESIWNPLWDTRVEIRGTAAKALCACLHILRLRSDHVQWYYSVYNQFKVGIAKGSAECVHGSLLVAKELLKHTGAFMIPRFKELCGAIVSMKDHKSIMVKVAIIKLIPDLASFCPDAFQRIYLDESVAILVQAARTSGEVRRCALLAIGQLCRTSGPALYDHIDLLDDMIREALGGRPAEGSKDKLKDKLKDKEASQREPTSSGPADIPPEALLCVADMIRGLGTPFHLRVVGLLDTMLQSGLTQELIETLSVISTNLPGQKGPVQQRLLEEVTKVLGGQSESLLKPQPPAYAYSWTGNVSTTDVGTTTNNGKRGASAGSHQTHGVGMAPAPAGRLSPTPPQQTPSRKLSLFKRVFGLGGSSEESHPTPKDVPAHPTAYYGFTGGALAYSFPAKGGNGNVGMSARIGNDGTRKNASLANLCGGRSAELVILSLRTLSTLASTQTGVGTPVPDHLDTTPNWHDSMSPHSKERNLSHERNLSSGWKGSGVQMDNFGPTPVYIAFPTPAAAAQTIIDEKVTPANRALSSGSLLIRLVPQIVIPLLFCDHTEVRREAVVTTAKLISSYAGTGRTRGPTALLVETALRALIEVCVTDASYGVRLVALSSLSAQHFEHFLSQSHHLQSLSLLLADENYKIRLGSLKLLGKLTSINGSMLQANMRKLLLQLISELRSGHDNRQKEETTHLLCTYMQTAPLHRIIKSFLPRIVSSLPLCKPSNVDIRLCTAALEALGDLASVCRTDMSPYVHRLLPIIMLHLQDPTSKLKQEKAINALGKLASATGFVVTPYLMFPLLLPYLLQMLDRVENASWSLRREVLRTLGILGALEPRKYGLIISHKKRYIGLSGNEIGNEGDTSFSVTRPSPRPAPRSSSDTQPELAHDVFGAGSSNNFGQSKELTSDEVLDEMLTFAIRTSVDGAVLNDKISAMSFEDLNAPVHSHLYETTATFVQPTPSSPEVARLTPSSDDFYPKAAFGELMNILRKPDLSVHHASTTQAIMFILKGLGMRCVPFLDDIIPYLLQMVRTCGTGLRESLLQQFAQLAGIVRHHLGPYLPEMLQLVELFWRDNTEHVLVLMEEIALSASETIVPYIPRFLPLLLSSLCLPKLDKADLRPAPATYGPVLPRTDSGLVAIESQASGLFALKAFRRLERALSCVDTLKDNIASDLSLVVPVMCKLISQLHDVGPDGCIWQVCTIRTLHRLLYSNCALSECNQVAMRLLQMLLRTISVTAVARVEAGLDKLKEGQNNKDNGSQSNSSAFEQDPYLRVLTECLSTVCSLGRQLGPNFLTFDHQLRASISVPGTSGLNTRNYDILIAHIKNRNVDREYKALLSTVQSWNEMYNDEEGEAGVGIGHNSSMERTSLFDFLERMDAMPPPFINSDLVYYSNMRTRGNYQNHDATSAGSGGGTSEPILTNMGSPGASEVKLPLNQLMLQRAWDTSQRSTSGDWDEWMRRLKIEFLRESPSLSLRACASLAQTYPLLGDALFHAAFVSCWLELSDPFKDSIIRALKKAIFSPVVSPEVIQIILNLAEFMEHDVEALPISPSILAQLAQRSHAYAKALHYWEMEFQLNPAECFESLIYVNKKLDMFDAAFGVVTVVKNMQAKRPDLMIEIRPGWLGKLGFWEEALAGYEEALSVDPANHEAILGKIKALDNLGRWEETMQLCISGMAVLKSKNQPGPTPSATSGKMSWHDIGVDESEATADMHNHDESISSPSRDPGDMSGTDILNRSNSASMQKTEKRELSVYARAAVVGARAAWALGEWNVMDSLVSELPDDNLDTTFLKAVLSVHQENFSASRLFIDRTRRHLDQGITALMKESYSRAYVHLVMVQQLSELEEIVEFKNVMRELSVGTVPRSGSFSAPSGPPPTPMGGPVNYAGMPTSPALTGHRGEAPSLWGQPPLTARKPQLGLQGSPVHRPHSSSFLARVPSLASLNGLEGDEGLTGVTSASTAVAASSDDSGLHAARQIKEEEIRKRKMFLKTKWRTKIMAGKSSGRSAIPFWQRLLNVHRMVLSEREELNTWLDFTVLCRRAKNFHLSDRVLSMIQSESVDRHVTPPPGPFGDTPSLGRFYSEAGSAPTVPILSRPPTSLPSPSSTEGLNYLLNRSSGADSPRRVFNIPDQKAVLVDPEAEILDRSIRFTTLRQYWGKDMKEYAITQLALLLDSIRKSVQSAAFQLPPAQATMRTMGEPVQREEDSSGKTGATALSTLHLECLLKLGHWKLAALGPAAEVDYETRKYVLSLYQEATQVDPRNYRAWHDWGLSNYRAVSQTYKTASSGKRRLSAGGGLRQRMDARDNLPEIQRDHIVGAVKGLMRAISLGTRKWSASVMQDMLYVLTMWFQYGHFPAVAAALEAGLATVHLDTWLGVLPQLIARIDHAEAGPRAILHNLISRLGAKHPQALVYPLFVALKATGTVRTEAAEAQLNMLRQHSGQLVAQTMVVSEELIRIAILWMEAWHEALEDASKHYFGEGNIVAMLDVLVPMHEQLERGPNTMHEAAFCQSYASDLTEAGDCLKRYVRIMSEAGKEIPRTGGAPPHGAHKNRAQMTQEEVCLMQLWDLYYGVFKRITTQLPTEMSLDLPNVSPLLVNCTNMNLAVPGSYSVDGNAVRIKGFGHQVQVIRSKQRPRKVRIIGEDGNDYTFLLKGHEDLRQDERVMQVFGLTNALLATDRHTDTRYLSIERYAVIPLSPNHGISGWVPNCDTLHDLIRDFRESRKVMLNVEQRLMQQVAPNSTYDQLTAIQKLEVFEYALAGTTGDDLAKILWYQSNSSESWLSRRTHFTRSLAVMSVVGYILGLGDRHPSNLMLNRKSGKIIHIDFGDCFEVAMQRDKFPEKVPFRLTRMLVKAMEVTGVDGTFRLTCQSVMSVMRTHGDSLMATLEAFVHDPLLSWKLLGAKKREKVKKDKDNNSRRSSLNHSTDPSHTEPPVAPVNIEPIPEPKLTKTARMLFDSVDISGERSAQKVILNVPSISSESLLTPLSRRKTKLSTDYSQLPLTGIGSLLTSDFTIGSLPVSKVDCSGPLNSIETSLNRGEDRHGKQAFKDHTRPDIPLPSDCECDDTREVVSVVDDDSVHSNDIDDTPLKPAKLSKSSIYGPDMYEKMASMSYTMKYRMSGVIMDPAPRLRRSGPMSNLAGDPGQESLLVPRGSDESVLSNVDIEAESLRADGVMTGEYGPPASDSKSRVAVSILDESLDSQWSEADEELFNEKGVLVIQRVSDKLTGLDFDGGVVPLDIKEQIDRLIKQATLNENLCTCFFGWCPFW